MRWFRLLFRLPGARRRGDIELYPPFWLMGIEVLESADNWRRVRIRLPLGFFTHNRGGSMFGGSMAALADPIPALACARIFPGYAVWTRSLKLEFEHVGDSDLELQFELKPDQERHIREELARRGRATPNFEMRYLRADGVCCARVHNTVALRPRGYRRRDQTEAAQD